MSRPSRSATEVRKARISTSLAEGEQRELEELARKLDRSVSWVVAQAVRALLAAPDPVARLGGAPHDEA